MSTEREEQLQDEIARNNFKTLHNLIIDTREEMRDGMKELKDQMKKLKDENKRLSDTIKTSKITVAVLVAIAGAVAWATGVLGNLWPFWK